MYTAPKAELIKLALTVSTSGGNAPAEEEFLMEQPGECM